MSDPTPLTEAGRILLSEHSSGTPHMARHIVAIEVEAADLFERQAAALTPPPSLPPVVDITGIDAIRRALVVEMENEGVVTWGDSGHRERFLAPVLAHEYARSDE